LDAPINLDFSLRLYQDRLDALIPADVISKRYHPGVHLFVCNSHCIRGTNVIFIFSIVCVPTTVFVTIVPLLMFSSFAHETIPLISRFLVSPLSRS